MSGPLLTYRQAADRLGVGVDTVRRHADAGRLSPIRLGTERGAFTSIIRFDPDEVDALIAARRAPQPRTEHSTADMRAWAKDQFDDVAETGPLPAHVVDWYRAAHGLDPAVRS